MPSSLTTVRPIASVCSTGPPASVCGTGARAFVALSGFSGTAPRRGSLARFPPGTGWRTWDFPHVPRPFGDGGVQNPAPPRRRRRRVAGRARCRNVHLPSIGLGSRLTLRPRLTLGGLAFPRKPRALGGRVARPSLATRASILTPRRSTGPRRARFTAPGKLPYRRAYNAASRRFGSRLSPVNCRRAPTRPVSCYALLGRVAASGPTSWLSARGHILCHSAVNLGPWRAVWAVSLSGARLSPRVLTPPVHPPAFGVRFPSVGCEAP